MNDPDYATRIAAVECLAHVEDARATSAIVARLRDTEPLVRVAAIEALVAIADEATATELRHLLDDANETVRAYAGWALGRLGDHQSLPALRIALQREQSPVVRAGVLESLYGLTRHQPYLELLVGHLRSVDPEARAFASNSLVGVASEATVQRLIEALDAAASDESLPAIRKVLERDLETLKAMSQEKDFDID